MDHGYFKDRISAWLDGELPPYEAQVVGEHLETCEECRALLERLKQVDTLVDKHSQIGGDDDYWEGMAQRIEERLGFGEEIVTDIRPKKRSGFGWKLAAAAASIAILTFIGIHQSDILKQQKPRTPTREAIPIDTTTQQAWLRSDSVEVAEKKAVAAGHEPAEQTMEQEGSLPTATGTTGQAVKPAAPTADKDEQFQAKADELQKNIDQRQADQSTRGAETQAERTSTEPQASAETDEAVKTRKTETQLRETPAGKTTANETLAKEKSDLAIPPPPPELPKTESATKAPSEVGHALVADSLSSISGEKTLQLPSSVSGGAESLTKLRDEQPSLALSGQFQGLVAPSAELTLAGWMHRRDSLETLWADLESSHGKLAIAKGRKEATLADASLVERQLLEAQYNVALLARDTDSTAYETAVDFLRSYQTRPDAQYHTSAQEYLDRLAADTTGGR